MPEKPNTLDIADGITPAEMSGVIADAIAGKSTLIFFNGQQIAAVTPPARDADMLSITCIDHNRPVHGAAGRYWHLNHSDGGHSTCDSSGFMVTERQDFAGALRRWQELTGYAPRTLDVHSTGCASSFGISAPNG